MSPLDAVRSTVRQYAVFNGRATRSELAWSVAAYFAAAALTCTVDLLLVGQLFGKAVVMPLTLVLIAASGVPLLAVAVRRLHDAGRSGWWYLVQLVPFVGPVWLVVLLCSASVPSGAATRAPRHAAQRPAPVDDGAAGLAHGRA